MGIVATPFVTTLVGATGLFVYTVVTLKFKDFAAESYLPSPNSLGYVAIGELVLVTPLWIGVEISNARRRRALPAGLTAVFLSIVSFIWMLTFLLIMGPSDQIVLMLKIPDFVQFGIVYLVSLGLAVLAVQPLIKGWLRKVRGELDASVVF